MLDFNTFKILESKEDYGDIMGVIKNAFNEMKDNDIATFHYEDVENYDHIFYVSIDIENDLSSISFEEFYEINKKSQQRLDDVNTAMSRIENIYDLTTDFEYDYGDPQHINPYFTIVFDMKSNKKAKMGEFWRVGVDENIQFDLKLIRKFLELSDIKIGTSSNGRNKFLQIQFENEEGWRSFVKNKEMVINKLTNYKINGVDMIIDLSRDTGWGQQEISKYREEIDRNEYKPDVYKIIFNLNPKIKFW